MAQSAALSLSTGRLQSREERLDSPVAKAQCRSTLSVHGGGSLQPLEALCADAAIVTGFLHLEHASVGRKADAPQRGQVMQQTSDLEVVAVVDCGFRAQARTAPARLMILLEVRVLVIDVQRRDDSLGNNARPASAVGRSLSLHPACKDQLHRFRSAQIDVLPDDLLKELPSMARAIPHLGQRKLRLQYREPVTV